MAKDADDLDLDVEGGKEVGKSKTKLIIFSVVGALLLVGVSVGATFFLLGGTGSHGEQDMAEGAEESKPMAPPVYLSLDPPFVVNFQYGSGVRYLQVAVEVMSRDPKGIEAVQQHMPAIRNNLVLLFSSLDFESISTREGKEKVRASVLDDIQKLLQENTGEPGIEAVYFTSFVMQ